MHPGELAHVVFLSGLESISETYLTSLAPVGVAIVTL
jgi:hypothetical protein